MYTDEMMRDVTTPHKAIFVSVRLLVRLYSATTLYDEVRLEKSTECVSGYSCLFQMPSSTRCARVLADEDIGVSATIVYQLWVHRWTSLGAPGAWNRSAHRPIDARASSRVARFALSFD